MKKVIFLSKKVIYNQLDLEVSSMRLYLKLFSQAKLYLAAIDSVSFCYALCVDTFHEDQIINFRITRIFSADKELLMELFDLWACGRDCKSVTFSNVGSFNHAPAIIITAVTHAAKMIVVLMIGANCNEIWKGCFGSTCTRVVRANTVFFITVPICLVLNIIDYSFIFMYDGIHWHYNLIVMGAVITAVLYKHVSGYLGKKTFTLGLTALLLLSDALVLKIPVHVLLIAQNLFVNRHCFNLLSFVLLILLSRYM